MNENLYIIITPTISKLGGGQIYSLNKLRYYQRKGWDTMLFHANHEGPIVIDDLRKYENNFINQFKFCTFSFSKQIVSKILKELIYKHGLNKYTKITIESHNIETATWGEMLASELHAKHIILLLSEFPKIKPNTLFDFFNFKEERDELAGIHPSSIKRLFSGHKVIDENRNHFLHAVCSNSIGPQNDNYKTNFKKYDYLIGTIGRLDKPYLMEAIDEIICFSKRYKNIRIAILFIGEGSNDVESRIKNKLSLYSNIQYEITGAIYPIPINLLRKPDMFFGVAGSCYVSNLIGKITVSFDVIDCKPIGILGATTNNATYRSDNETQQDFSDLLQKILIDKKFTEIPKEIDIEEVNNIDFTSHERFVDRSSKFAKYYDVINIHLEIKEKIKKLLITLLGVQLFYKLKSKYIR